MKNKFLTTCLLCLLWWLPSTLVLAQVAINSNGSEPDESAILDLSSTDRGLLVPRMDSAARLAIENPADGLMVFDSTDNHFWFYHTEWKRVDNDRQTLVLHEDRLSITKGDTVDLSYLKNIDASGLSLVAPNTTLVRTARQTLDDVINPSLPLEWQSFVANHDGYIAQIDISIRHDFSVGSLVVREGEGRNGLQLLQVDSIELNDGWNSIRLDTLQVILQQGQQYTFEIAEYVGEFRPGYGVSTNYGAGRAGASEMYDMTFRAFMIPLTTYTEEIIQINNNNFAYSINLTAIDTLFFSDGTYLTNANQLNDQWLSNDGGQEGIRINNAGNVGIGVELPQARLDVDGEILLSHAATEMGLITELENNTPILNLALNAFTPNVDANKLGGLFRMDSRTVGNNPLFQWIQKPTGATGVTGSDLLMSLDEATGLDVNGTVSATSYTGDGSGLTNVPGDDLGSHTASQNIQLSDQWLSNDGGNEGLKIENDGDLLLGGDLIVGATNSINLNNNQTAISFFDYGPANFEIFMAAPVLLESDSGLKLNGSWISNDGGNEGLSIDNNGSINTSSNLGVGGHISAQNYISLANNGQILNLVTDELNNRIILDVGGSGHSSDAIVLGEVGNGSPNPVLMRGNLGVGTFSAPQKLTVGVQGDGTKAVANEWDTWSDQRLKRDFAVLSDPLDKLQAINGYYYYWTADKADQTRQVGVIAQEIEAVLPEIVTTNPDGYKSVDYSKLTALLIEVNQAQEAKLQQQQTEIHLLKTQVEQLNTQMAKINQLETTLQQLQVYNSATTTSNIPSKD